MLIMHDINERVVIDQKATLPGVKQVLLIFFIRSSTKRAKMDFLTKEEIEDFRKAFSLFDNDGSGTISSRELITAMQNLNLRPTEDEIQSIIRVTLPAVLEVTLV